MCKNWQIIIIQATMKPHQQGRKIKTRCRSETCPRLILLYVGLRKKCRFPAMFHRNGLRPGV